MTHKNQAGPGARGLIGFLAGLVVLVAGFVQPDARAVTRNAEDMLIVDCLLPGQIRKLGMQATFMSARRPIRTSQADCEIRGGEYVAYDRANYQTAIKVWLEQAMSGSAEAQNNVGEIYSKGLGTEPDYGMAFQWFKKAADQGYARAKINLGYLYEEGLGITKDPAAALNLYRDAAGITDELMYASVVEVQLTAKDERITGLQQQVTSEQATSAQLRDQVAVLQRELAQRRAALGAAQRELEETRSRLSQATSAEDKELMKLLENQLLTQEQQINNQRTQLASLEQQAGGSAAGVFAGAPMLQILDPMVVATRGRNTAVYRGAPGKRALVGRVSSPQSLQQVTVNGVAAPLAANGTFSVDIDVPASGAHVAVVATDRRGAEGRLEFTVLPQTGSAPSNGNAAPTVARNGVGSLPANVRLGRYYAVVIGNNSYRDSNYPALTSAGNDASAVASLLKSRYGYETRLVLNGDRMGMLSALNDMREKLKPEDNLLVYFAGHGEITPEDGQGYWIPIDGIAGNRKTWISNAAISDVLETISARHVLVVADSCYSGTMTRNSVPAFDASMQGEEWAKWVKMMVKGRARIALTSGGVQPVPDTGAGNHSYFARAFLNVLQDNNRLLEAQRLYRELSTYLALSAIDAPLAQVPGYSPIRYAGHESGEFFFLPQGATGAATGAGP